jgi:two-component system, OmpR family, sensor histidine kinase KdpD
MTDLKRPTPEELLARYGFAIRKESRRRGWLRVFLGAAPGVGKTYAMLLEGRRLKGEGLDVVVGFVETHGRAETAAQIDGLEVIPRKIIEYRGVNVEEMDTDAIIQRGPQVALVDELAHTNAPGSKREKRYEDIEEIRDAGIDVISTVNVQHLESLNDVVESITGIEVRETIPDRVLDGATEVQLIDLPVAGLIERLEKGKIYPGDRAQQALQNFFREGNLTALRELALRRTAAGVDEMLESYMREHNIEAVWPAAERVVVVVDPISAAGALIRRACHIAGGLHAELVALFVVPSGANGSFDSDQLREVERAGQLAEDLGAAIRTTDNTSMPQALVKLLNDENASIVVVGHKPTPRWRWPFHKTLVENLFENLDNVDVHLVELDPGKV